MPLPLMGVQAELSTGMFFSELEEQLAVVTNYASALSTAYVALIKALADKGLLEQAEIEALLAIIPPGQVPMPLALPDQTVTVETLRAIATNTRPLPTGE